MTRECGWEAVLRTRATQGINIDNFQGNFYLRGNDLLALPIIDSDKVLSMDMQFAENATINERSICVQSALLYTTSSGERCIRVHTLCLPVTSNAQELYSSANRNVIAALLAKQALSIAISQGLGRAREHINNKFTSLLRAFKQDTGSPDWGALADLPCVCLGMLKSPAFQQGAGIIPSDKRASFFCFLRSLPADNVLTFFKPGLFALHHMAQDEGELLPDGSMKLPQSLRLSHHMLDSDGVHLLYNGLETILRVGSNAQPQLLQDLFGVSNFQEIRSPQTTLILHGESGPLLGQKVAAYRAMMFNKALLSNFSAPGIASYPVEKGVM